MPQEKPVEYPSRKNGKLLLFNNFVYNYEDRKNEINHWRCQDRKCKGRLLTDLNLNVTGMVELIEMTDPKPVPSLKGQGFKTTGLRMLSFRVKDIDRVYELLLEKNCTFLSPPKHLKWDKYSVKACCFLDPDDVLIEIMEFLPLTES